MQEKTKPAEVSASINFRLPGDLKAALAARAKAR